MLTLCEELVCLSIHESKGRFIGSSQEPLKVGLGGSVLIELSLLGKIKVTENHRLQLIDDSKTDNECLDEALSALKESEKERKIGYWLNSLGRKKDKFSKQIIESLFKKNILTEEDDRFIWVVPSPLQPDKKASTKYWVLRRLRSALLESNEYQPRDIILLSLLRSLNMLDFVFLRDERKLASRSINQLFYNQAMNDPVFQTIEEIGTAISEIVEED